MTDRSDGLNQVLAELRAAADRPPERAVSAPPALYNRADVLDLEIERIFRKGWACAGFAAEIPNPGDYLTYSIVDQPVVVIRGDDGEVRAFSNVCRHRMAVLLEGRGAARRLICPYHAWTYGLDGGLIGAGHMERTACFDRGDYALPAVRCEVWNGFIYLTLNPDARGMAETLAPLEPVVARYDMAGYLPVLHQEQTWDTNWKVLVENFMEGYHGPVAHKPRSASA
ncbi:MAG: aromatic ring-hydroxylating dioxygenase subunit alpha [Caulobacteraceae bacterium]